MSPEPRTAPGGRAPASLNGFPLVGAPLPDPHVPGATETVCEVKSETGASGFTSVVTRHLEPTGSVGVYTQQQSLSVRTGEGFPTAANPAAGGTRHAARPERRDHTQPVLGNTRGLLAFGQRAAVAGRGRGLGLRATSRAQGRGARAGDSVSFRPGTSASPDVTARVRRRGARHTRGNPPPGHGGAFLPESPRVGTLTPRSPFSESVSGGR